MEVAILGSTGNVYHVMINEQPLCDCPDFNGGMYSSGGYCKHILFSLIRVLKLPRYHPLLLKRTYTTSDIADIFSRVRITATVSTDAATSDEVRRAYRQMLGIPGEGTDACSSVPATEDESTRKPMEEDAECTICYEEFSETPNEATTWCRAQCGNNFHLECFNKWKNSAAQRHEPTCPLCRAVWQWPPGEKPAAAPVHLDGYQNLSHISGQDPATSFLDRSFCNYGRRRRGYGRYC
jgi:hypothetical protein